MILLGALLLILGFVTGIGLLELLGIIVLVLGAVLWLSGSAFNRPVAGRRHWY